MELKTTEQRYREFLDTLPLSTLRILGRQKGVGHASSSNKSALIEEIIRILTGKQAPAPPTNRGAPVKQTFLDPSVSERLEAIRRNGEKETREREAALEVASEERTDPPAFDAAVYTGILEILQGGYGFVRAHNCQPSSAGEDVFIPAPVIHNNDLREGDYIACTATPRQRGESAAVGEILGVNGRPVGMCRTRPRFDNLTALYAQEKIELSKGNKSLSLRMLDLFAPIGKGQRALVIAPPKAGKTTLLKEIARAVCEQHPELMLIVLLIDERPEEVTDFCETVKDAEVISSTFDEGAEHHVRAAHLALEHAKRCAELGENVVLLLDSLTKLTRACNILSDNSGKTLSGGLDASAFAVPKRFFGAARNTKEAGSITILATVLVETGSRMDDVIYEEFKGTGNSDIFLSRELAERRIFPAIDLRRSGTRKEELLLSEKELSAGYRGRARGPADTPGSVGGMERAEDNADCAARLPELLRIYKNTESR